MAKDPAFLFYPNDWDGGVKLFTRQNKGAYIDLLICQFHNGHLSLEDIEFLLGSDFSSMWESKLKSKFKQDENGLFFNVKLEEEQIKRKKWTESRRKNAEHMVEHMPKHMVNVNVDVNEIKKKVVFRKPSLDQVIEYCKEIKSTIDPEQFFHNYESTNWIKANGQRVMNWKSTIRTWEKRSPQKKESEQTDNQKRDSWEKGSNKNCVQCRGSGAIYSPGSGKYSKCGCVKI